MDRLRERVATAVVAIALVGVAAIGSSLLGFTAQGRNPAAQRQEIIRLLGSIDRQLGAIHATLEKRQPAPSPKDK